MIKNKMVKNFMMYWMYNRKTIGYMFLCFTTYMTHRILCIMNIR